jgi:hypothetical protein
MGTRRAPSWGAGTVLLALGVFLWGCNGTDPLPQEVIDGLPAEEGSPSATHRPGQPCLACHSTYGEATPALAIGGTVYKQDLATQALLPAPGVRVLIDDSTGDSRIACTNSAGNFFIEKEKWAELTFPLKVSAGPRRMASIIGREGSCATCHKYPAGPPPDVGEAKDSAGVILVEEGDVDPMTCGVVP